MSFRPHLLSGLATVAIVASALPAPAYAQQSIAFDIPAQDLGGALRAFAQASGVQVIFDGDALRGKRSPALRGSYSADAALTALLRGSGMSAERNAEGVFVVTRAVADNATTDDGGYTANEIVVTAQKRVESAQKVPIAISVLSQKNLEEQKIESGADIMRAVPNLTFSKSNFTSYNISIRGIGTKAVSATTDPGVAVSFNNVGIIHNRFFEQEFFDMERMEVLRGPQGTLYGRNATGGVINLISAKPKLDRFAGSIKGEIGNYNSRRMVGMLNIPIVSDELGLRIAGSMTDRDGYDYNSITQNRINGRDLWSLRTTLGFEKPGIRGNIIWERFHENDNRSRTGKQLCHRDDSPMTVGSTPTFMDNPSASFARFEDVTRALFSQGCKPGSLYDDAAFGTPNGLAISYVAGAALVGTYQSVGWSDGYSATLIDLTDPYGGRMQSRNMREIASVRDPRYRANADIIELNLDVDLVDGLTLSSQTAFNWDKVYSVQDYNRFNTDPIFNDTSKWTTTRTGNTPSRWSQMSSGGVFCDPQLGCSDRLAVFDISSAYSKQFAQEVRIQSDFDGPFNFSVGGNYTRFKTQNDYYVLSNIFTMIAMVPPFNMSGNGTECGYDRWYTLGPAEAHEPLEYSFCPYIDPNSLENMDGDGHNYFRSSNPYKLQSYAAFGEAYYNINPDLKLTAGLRYTRDQKRFTLVPSQLLLAPSLGAGGYIGTGYPSAGDLKLKWGEFTGRIGLDWSPQLSFTNQSLFYAFFSRGYKAGGMNPPTPGFATLEQVLGDESIAEDELAIATTWGMLPVLELNAVNYGPTFKPEFVNAFEIGTKNVLMGGRLTLNANAFFYDYNDYQVSQIRDRTAVNENFDAKVWGAELSAQFEPVDRLRLNANVGWLKTKIGKGQTSIDPMNRTLGNPDYTLFKPWLQLPSNCVVPTPMTAA
ncbi:TonB-dependent receptor domain-containing protein [Sphingopyxis granuli]|uniref:TonB-dependent receptor domain-containing protein n=1 Tax=Sphingopyxis granuli TaxID=267128 RepID=UPI001BAF2091|nr:TonB-dependent receptor [Sphingopyxis granuli]QUM73674.1 TonB-dependent receptor [Sphingopyxis granuli]